MHIFNHSGPVLPWKVKGGGRVGTGKWASRTEVTMVTVPLEEASVAPKEQRQTQIQGQSVWIEYLLGGELFQAVLLKLECAYDMKSRC